LYDLAFRFPLLLRRKKRMVEAAIHQSYWLWFAHSWLVLNNLKSQSLNSLGKTRNSIASFGFIFAK
jgi:hypothetical protein